MAKIPEHPRLVAGELEILEILWQLEHATIIEVQRALPGEPGYTTAQTRLDRMVKKKLVKKSKLRPAKYSAAIRPTDVVQGDMQLLLDKVSQGRITPLVAHLVKDRTLTAQEIRELKALIKEAEQRNKSN